MSQDMIGQTIGNYRIDEQIGSGGMGQVYRSTHVLLSRQAALKVMHPHLAADPNFRARFLQEAKAAADLDHRNIVQVHDFGEHESQFYLVMELIDGGSLRMLLRDRESRAGSWSMRTALDLVRQAAEGLNYAHTKNMVHRDIKPDNLLLKQEDAESGRNLTIKISDFGLARLAESAVMTASGVTMGTPAYMSPEQAQGKELDGRSDIYSLGVVLYELATGYLPFDTRTLSDAVYKHVFTEPTPPRQANPEVSESVEQVILRCLQKTPDARYASAAELARAVQAVLDGIDPSTVVPQPPPTQIGDHGSTTRRPVINETVLDRPGGDPPPFVPTLVGVTQTPRLQVLRQNGEPFQVVELTGEGLTLGRLAGNDLVLPDESISRHHLRFDWDGSRVLVTDLGSRNGALLGGHRLLPQVPQSWNAGDWLQVGTFWVRLDLPDQSTAQGTAGPHTAAVPISPQPVPGSQGRIQVMLEHQDLNITPGEPATVRGTLVNLGNTVDHISVAVEGVPDDWVTIPTQEAQLNPGGQTPLMLQVNVPRAPSSYAGQYPVTVRGKSRENPGESGVAQAMWTVQPFSESQLTLNPSRAGGRTRASFKMALANAGNETARFSFRGRDDEDALKYQFQKDHVELAPDETATIPLKVQAPRRWIGNAEDRSFQIESVPARGAPKSISGQMQHKAMIPVWAIPVIGVALVGLVLLLNFLLTPSIQAFELDESDAEYLAGQDVTISWNVSRARSVEIANLPEGISLDENGSLPGRSELTVTPNWTGEHTLRLVARSFLKTREEVIQISVLPPDPDAPTIDTFAVEPANITAGETVMISWSVANADNVTLELPNGTTRDGLPSEGELPDTPDQTGAYILKASNGGVSAAPELFQVEVVAPEETPTPESEETEAPTEQDDEDGGAAEDMDEPDPTPEPKPMPVINLDPSNDSEISEGACLTLEWNIQHAMSVEFDGSSVSASGEEYVCPVATKTYTWNVSGEDGNHYSESVKITVDPMDVDGTTTLDDLVGTWINPDADTFGVTRIVITEAAPDSLGVDAFMRCLPPAECELDGWGIEFDSVTAPADMPKPVVEYEDPQDVRMVIGRKGDNLVMRVYYAEFDYLHEYELDRQIILHPPLPLPDFEITDPDLFFRDGLEISP